jgi:hypothetical protein
MPGGRKQVDDPCQEHQWRDEDRGPRAGDEVEERDEREPECRDEERERGRAQGCGRGGEGGVGTLGWSEA